MSPLVLVAFGGAIGSVLRYLVGTTFLRLLGASFPWGTLAVNVVGSLAIGLLTELIARKVNASADLRLFLVVGVLGGFTTFSSFSLDALALAERGAGLAALLYVLASVSLALLAAYGGLLLGRSLF